MPTARNIVIKAEDQKGREWTAVFDEFVKGQLESEGKVTDRAADANGFAVKGKLSLAGVQVASLVISTARTDAVDDGLKYNGPLVQSDCYLAVKGENIEPFVVYEGDGRDNDQIERAVVSAVRFETLQAVAQAVEREKAKAVPKVGPKESN